MDGPVIREVEGGIVFSAKIVPGSSKTCVTGALGGMVKIKVSTAPEKGKANQRLIEFLAKKLGVKKNAVSIISGSRSPVKQVKVMGTTREKLLEKLGINST